MEGGAAANAALDLDRAFTEVQDGYAYDPEIEARDPYFTKEMQFEIQRRMRTPPSENVKVGPERWKRLLGGDD
jgi:hypothetical protein